MRTDFVTFSEFVHAEWDQAKKNFLDFCKTGDSQVFLLNTELLDSRIRPGISISEIHKEVWPNHSPKGASSTSLYQIKNGLPIIHMMFGGDEFPKGSPLAISSLARELVLGLYIVSRFSATGALERINPRTDLSRDLHDLAHNLQFIRKKSDPKLSANFKEGISIVHSAVWREIVTDPQLIYALSSLEFEELVGEILHRSGFKVELTKRSRDGGKDIVASKDSLFGHEKIAVECKCYNVENKVGIDVVQRLFGVQESLRSTRGIIATSSFFTDPAREFADLHKSRLTLWDYWNLDALLRGFTS